MKTLLLTLTYLVGIGELILAIYFWVTNSKNEIRKVMALLALSTGIWVITSGLTLCVSQTPITTFFMQLVFVSGALLITALLHLSLIFPNKLIQLDPLHGWLLYGPAIVFTLIMFVSDSIVMGFTGSVTDVGRIIPGPLYSLYNLYVFWSLYFSACILFPPQKFVSRSAPKKSYLDCLVSSFRRFTGCNYRFTHPSIYQGDFSRR